MPSLPSFDCGALIEALDAKRAQHELGWTALADELWAESADLNVRLADDCLCPGALVRHARHPKAMTCQYATIILRWLQRAPEDFLTGPTVAVGDTRLPDAGLDSRLRWDLPQLHAALNEYRSEHQLTWVALADSLDCKPSRLTNLRNARLADMDLAMRITQRLAEPAARFIHPAQW
ncbi:MAG: hypothetical protein ABI140_04295 [Jatrophihabitantaceae bacterium]